ncbi:hypothetical protein EQ871_12635 [Enterococcus casseliflavus]|jgi:hypothetical protein|uniref:hypothetical protein n=1 Tax=Enterococcus casseliflavus TaxID=37734 RepID=UPI00076B3DCB|nr:hypothetical protein [Enterococcus casseliflavus]AMG51585.1 hypothetical protein AL523_17705 [Enterococcus gallinarum]RXA62191.1 hypothetical protein EQ871_12635 [Enterococcus casseliflavus]
MDCRFIEVEGLSMACPKTMSLKEANRMLFKKNEEVDMEGIDVTFHYELIQDDRVVLRSQLYLPVFDFDWWELVEEFLYEKGASEEVVNQFSESFKNSLEDVPEIMTVKTKKEKKPKRKKERIPNEKAEKKQSPTNWFYVMGMAFVSLALLVVLGFGVNQVFFTEGQTLTYEELIDQQQFEEAYQLYPKEQQKTETFFYHYTLDNRSEATLRRFRDFHEEQETTFGSFDLAILKNDYSGAVSAYEEQKEVFSTDSDRLAIVGYCYLKVGEIDEAKQVNSQINSIELEKKIVLYEQLTLQIQAAEREIEALQEEATLDREELEKQLNDLFDLKEERLNL